MFSWFYVLESWVDWKCVLGIWCMNSITTFQFNSSEDVEIFNREWRENMKIYLLSSSDSWRIAILHKLQTLPNGFRQLKGRQDFLCLKRISIIFRSQVSMSFKLDKNNTKKDFYFSSKTFFLLLAWLKQKNPNNIFPILNSKLKGETSWNWK